MSLHLCQMTRSPPIGKSIWAGRYNNVSYWIKFFFQWISYKTKQTTVNVLSWLLFEQSGLGSLWSLQLGHSLYLRDTHSRCSFIQVNLQWIFFSLQELNSLEPHENFRLWLTAESHPKFPTILLQSSLKVTYEVSWLRSTMFKTKFRSSMSGGSVV